jgi:hypothetical protein
MSEVLNKLNYLKGHFLFINRFSPDIASKRGLTAAEMSAVEAIHRAVEFNPHVPKVNTFSKLEFLIILKIFFVLVFIRNEKFNITT